MKCIITDCQGTVVAKGYCCTHYNRVRRHGDPNTVLKRGRKSVPLHVRFHENYTVVESGCWEWNGYADGVRSNGYGRVAVGSKRLDAHRVSWTLHNGPIPEGEYVLHKCDNKVCVNPEHLFLGDHTSNMADMVSKGRQVKGSDHHLAVLNEHDIPIIRFLRAHGSLLREIAVLFGVSKNTIRQVVIGNTWKHVD